MFPNWCCFFVNTRWSVMLLSIFTRVLICEDLPDGTKTFSQHELLCGINGRNLTSWGRFLNWGWLEWGPVSWHIWCQINLISIGLPYSSKQDGSLLSDEPWYSSNLDSRTLTSQITLRNISIVTCRSSDIWFMPLGNLRKVKNLITSSSRTGIDDFK